MIQCRLSCVCVIAFICLNLRVVSPFDYSYLRLQLFNPPLRFDLDSKTCKSNQTYRTKFERRFYCLDYELKIRKRIWSRIVLFTLPDDESVAETDFDIIDPAINKVLGEPTRTLYSLWTQLPVANHTEGKYLVDSGEHAALKRYHKNYYKSFRDVELSRLQLINCDKLWVHPTTLQHYSLKFVPIDAPFKVPCQVCTKKRYSSNIRNVFFKCKLKAFIELDKGGQSKSSCQPFYEDTVGIPDITRANAVMHMVEQMYGDQLYDGGGFYLHFFPYNEMAYNFTEDTRADFRSLSSGIFYCMEGRAGEGITYPDAEVIQVVDIVSFRKAKQYSMYKPLIHVPLNSTCGISLNLQYHIIWQKMEPCCLSTNQKRYKLGIVTVRKIDPTKTIFWGTAPINESSVLPTQEKFDGKRDALGLIDVAFSLPLFYEYGIRVSSSYARELDFEDIMRKLIGSRIPDAGVLYDYENCPDTVPDIAAFESCKVKNRPVPGGPLYRLKKKKEGKKKSATKSKKTDFDSSCIPCTIPRNMHRTMERKGNFHVEFRLLQHIIVSCLDPNKKAPDLQSITWQKEKSHVIGKCRGLNTSFVINGELHIHAARREDAGTYICKIKGKQVKSVRLSVSSGKWISDFWFYFCIIVPGTLLILGLLIWCQIIPDCCLKASGVGLVAQMALDYGRDIMQMQKEEKEAQGLEKKKLYVARQLARNRRVHA
ncbi:hypothetical protein TTRE_0000103601 [Trichuris trichiura]|uniref:Ig-like domain-containing protein n=1 Tax=Trichuris trichiura TaxID=36087 RepID=A0A077YYG9_TRITR|nr:hypothetical protein TTRE_0000103601 [Trichuris trichiura]